jgi:hypothetical protein
MSKISTMETINNEEKHLGKTLENGKADPHTQNILGSAGLILLKCSH